MGRRESRQAEWRYFFTRRRAVWYSGTRRCEELHDGACPPRGLPCRPTLSSHAARRAGCSKRNNVPKSAKHWLNFDCVRFCGQIGKGHFCALRPGAQVKFQGFKLGCTELAEPIAVPPFQLHYCVSTCHASFCTRSGPTSTPRRTSGLP